VNIVRKLENEFPHDSTDDYASDVIQAQMDADKRKELRGTKRRRRRRKKPKFTLLLSSSSGENSGDSDNQYKTPDPNRLPSLSGSFPKLSSSQKKPTGGVPPYRATTPNPPGDQPFVPLQGLFTRLVSSQKGAFTMYTKQKVPVQKPSKTSQEPTLGNTVFQRALNASPFLLWEWDNNSCYVDAFLAAEAAVYLHLQHMVEECVADPECPKLYKQCVDVVRQAVSTIRHIQEGGLGSERRRIVWRPFG
jgi:hypothetical protein